MNETLHFYDLKWFKVSELGIELSKPVLLNLG
jgi:hypothetical protein